MLLCDVFLAITSPTLTLSFLDSELLRQDIEFSKRKTTQAYRLLKDESKILAYQKFLAHCERCLDDLDKKPRLAVIFSYFTNSDLLPEHDLTHADKLAQLFLIHFQQQHTALSIAMIGQTLIDRPVAFLGFLRYLLQCNVTPDDILSTHLLQDYFRYYFITIGAPVNPINACYALLSSCPETMALNILANTIRCEEESLAPYAINGKIHKETYQTLVTVPRNASLQFTEKDSNMNALHAVFGIDYLMGCLMQWQKQLNNPIWIKIVTQQFNQMGVVKTQLPKLLDLILDQSQFQIAVASLLNDRTLSLLIENHVVSVNSLIPFIPKLITLVQEQDFMAYLHGIQQHKSSTLTLIPNLMVLFQNLQRPNPSAALLVYDALLDATLEMPLVLEDPDFVKKLKKFAHADEKIIQKALSLEAVLESVCIRQTQHTIKDMDYFTIEDAWRHTTQKIKHLQEIIAFKTNCPSDKYKLYQRIATLLFIQNKTAFDLDAFVDALNIEPQILSDTITPYERLIIALIVAIDDVPLRKQLTDILDKNVDRPWRTFTYGNICLYKQAALSGNVGLIQDLESTAKYPDYAALAVIAAQESQWQVVIHIHQSQPLKNVVLKILLHAAVSQGASSAIPYLTQTIKQPLGLKTIEEAFKKAAFQNDYKSTLVLLESLQPPSDTVMTKVFKQAIELKQFEIAKLIASRPVQKHLKEAITQALSHAARLNRCDVLTVLSQLDAHYFEQISVGNALLSATRENSFSAVQFLANHASPTAIQAALKEARKKKCLPIEAFLLTKGDTHQPAQLSPAGRKRHFCKTRVAEKIPTSAQLTQHRVHRAASCSAISFQGELNIHSFFNHGSTSIAIPKLKRQLSR